ncbi:hypothetical protein J4212_06570 [Candidatus Woesearchaeota archaeon]|nr:hypothetical protein [Candidatus Woesearchaeota archaeon]
MVEQKGNTGQSESAHLGTILRRIGRDYAAPVLLGAALFGTIGFGYSRLNLVEQKAPFMYVSQGAQDTSYTASLAFLGAAAGGLFRYLKRKGRR